MSSGQTNELAYLRVPRPIDALANGLGEPISEPTIAAPRLPFGGLPVDSPQAHLFEAMRKIRRRMAGLRGYPPYFVLTDRQLAQLCSLRPDNAVMLLTIKGFGCGKLHEYGEELLRELAAEAGALGLDLCSAPPPGDPIEQARRPQRSIRPAAEPRQVSGVARQAAFAAFARGEPLGDVCLLLNRSPGTTVQWLLDYLIEHPQPHLRPWLSDELLHCIEAVGLDHSKRLQPVHEALGGEVPYPLLQLAQGFLLLRQSQANSLTSTVADTHHPQ
ncbi:MAG: hypothetical protein EXR77_07055 [Myxococcales bacterium]|nr:hypothetical protein [Myxococcales bacterium]